MTALDVFRYEYRMCRKHMGRVASVYRALRTAFRPVPF